MTLRLWHQPASREPHGLPTEPRHLVWWEHGGIIGDCEWPGWWRYWHAGRGRDWLLNFTLVRLDVEWATYADNRLEVMVGLLGFLLFCSHTFGRVDEAPVAGGMGL